MFLDVETIIRVIILHESNALYYSVLVQVQGMLNVHQTKKELLLNNNSEKKTVLPDNKMECCVG